MRIHPELVIYGKSFKLVFDHANQADTARITFRHLDLPWVDETGFTHQLTVRPDKSALARRQGRVLGKLWETAYEYINNMENPEHGPNWKLAVNGGRLHVVMGQRPCTLFYAKPHPPDGTFTIRADSGNMDFYQVFEEVANSWISEAIAVVL